MQVFFLSFFFFLILLGRVLITRSYLLCIHVDCSIAGLHGAWTTQCEIKNIGCDVYYVDFVKRLFINALSNISFTFDNQ